MSVNEGASWQIPFKTSRKHVILSFRSHVVLSSEANQEEDKGNHSKSFKSRESNDKQIPSLKKMRTWSPSENWGSQKWNGKRISIFDEKLTGSFHL